MDLPRRLGTKVLAERPDGNWGRHFLRNCHSVLVLLTLTGYVTCLLMLLTVTRVAGAKLSNRYTDICSAGSTGLGNLALSSWGSSSKSQSSV